MRSRPIALLLLLLASTAWAQTDPRTLPLANLPGITKLGTIRLPDNWNWGAHPMSVQGDLMTVGCHIASVGVVRIPALGGTATIVEPCRIVPTDKVKPGDPNGSNVGGLLRLPDRVLMTAFAYYNGSGVDEPGGTHFSAATLDGLVQASPVRVGAYPIRTGFINGPMGLVPPEWQALLGGAGLTMQCCIPIIVRSSLGPSVAVFDPLNLLGPARWLVGYPYEHPTLGIYEGAWTYYSGASQAGTVFIPPGTRSLVVVKRLGSTWCYGTGAECNDPTDPEKGNHGHPYTLIWVAYDLAQVLAAKNPWDAVPYAKGALPGVPTSGVSNMHRGGWFDPVTHRLYVAYQDSGTIDVFHVPRAAPVTDKDCIPGTVTITDTQYGACEPANTPLGGERTVTETWVRTGDIPAEGNGKACGPTTGTTTRKEPCAWMPPPPPPDPSYVGRFASQATYTVNGAVAGVRVTLRSAPTVTLPAAGAAVKFLLPLPGGTHETRPGTIYRIRTNYYANGDHQVVVQIPGIAAVSLEVLLSTGQ